ncbi:MAG: xanthine dehydrogenase family protein molybdopterin-binding subunit [SAR202 cluster bacterium]|nr:xanthine dehydrogenase family protein molybdopterin-binding subunit [SAR202 cluster bacterium]
MTTTMFGASVKRREDPRLITGKGTYVDDVRLVGMLHMFLVRAPYAHANIKKVDTSKAKKAPGVVAVFTGAELKDKLGSVPCGWVVPDTKEVPHPPIAIDKVNCVGEAVAAVIASSLQEAADAAALVDVDYEVLPALVDMEKATSKGVAQIHTDAPKNVAFEWQVAGGDVEAAAKSAQVRVKERIINQRLIPNSMETRGIVADYNSGTNQITFWTSTQIPHLVRLLLALVTGHPEHSIRVIAPEVGGGFGCKLYLYAEDVIAFVVAKELGRPVKWIEQRQENYLATTHGRDHVSDVEIMGNRDGTITGLNAHTYANMGAYLSTFAPAIPTYLFGLVLSGPYKIPNIVCKVTGVFTNTTPVDAYRGAGRPEATYLVERMVDRFAAEIGMDPVEVRRKNFIPPFENGYPVATGVEYDSGNYVGALDKAAEMAGYKQFRKEQAEARKKGRYLGLGVSSYIEICGMAPSAVAYSLGARAGVWESSLVRVHPTGKVTVFTGASGHGQGHETTFAQLAASELGIPMEDVEVVHGDTAQVQMGTGTFGSRSAVVGGTALHMSVGKVIDKAKKIAANLLEASPEDTVFKDGKFFVKGAPAKSKTFQEVALAAYWYASMPEGVEPGLEAMSIFDPKAFTWPFGTHMAVVEVDPDTGSVKLLRYVCVDDVGKVINPMIVDGMVHGGIAQGVGQAMQEEAVYGDDGQLLTGSMLDYALPTANDFPVFETARTETPSPTNPLGVKGAGEAATIASSPAIINAVVDALSPFGVKHMNMPAKSEKVWRLIQASKKK